MAELIYEHKGMKTYRTAKGIVQVVHQGDGPEAYAINLKGLHNAADKLRLLDGSGFTPALLRSTDRMMLQEDLGDSESTDGWTPTDWQNFRRALVACLLTMRQHNLRHGDLNGNNIIIRKKLPYIIDWQEAHFINDPPPQTAPLHDAYFLCTDIIRWVGDPEVSDPYRVCRRWNAILGDLMETSDCTAPMRGKTLLDVGCFQGDFSAMAAAEGFKVMGIDTGGFRQGEDSITIARNLWGGVDNLRFHRGNIDTWGDFTYDVILFMDVFPYLVRDFGGGAAIVMLRLMVEQAGRVYFEVQQWGDKSGIEWLVSDEDVRGMVPDAEWTKIATFPEDGFDRTLWRIEKCQ